jgi:hypothetical protein
LVLANRPGRGEKEGFMAVDVSLFPGAAQDQADKDERDQVISYLRSQLLGPIGGVDEILTAPPRVRYLLGILFPQHAAAEAFENDDVFDGDEGAGKDGATADGVPDEGIATVNDWYPSSLGISFYVVGSDRIHCLVSGARYEQISSGKNRSWKRHAIGTGEPLEVRKPLDGFQTSDMVLEGRAELRTLWRSFRDGYLVTATLINAVTMDFFPTDDVTEEQRRAHDAACLHQVGLRCASQDGAIQRYPSVGDLGRDAEDAELKLQYEHADVFAIGHGCSVTWPTDASMTTIEVAAEHMPQFDVPALRYDLPGFDTVLRVSNLYRLDKVPLIAHLSAFVGAYEEWIDGLRRTLVSDEMCAAKNRILQRLDAAAGRMRGGIATLDCDETALRAFRLANRAMLVQMYQTRNVIAGKSYKRNEFVLEDVNYDDLEYTWRPFQLAFQLLTLTSITDESGAERDIVDLIWFPTGGGKTEAYLAVAAFTIFLRRFKDGVAGAGTAVITRYTLTLLTAQQFQRAATLICACERLRWSESDLGSSPITIGLWVGDQHAPNRFADAAEKFKEILIEGEVRNPFQLQQCPWCGTEVVPLEGRGDRADYGIRADESSFEFNCPTDTCPFHESLPVAVIDEELYRNPPTLLLATVDKFAALPWDPRPSVFFGAGEYKSPALIIQDELHLLSGPLGTTVGTYECAIEALISLYGVKPKIIASTATIRRASDQIVGLFGRSETSVFPPAGLDSRDSYFARVDSSKPGRRYIGIMPQSHSTPTSVVNTTISLLQAVIECDISAQAIDAFWTVVIYHNSLRELGRTVTLARDDMPERLPLWASSTDRARKLDDEQIMELRSNVGGERLPKMLLRLNKPFNDPDAASIVACTNMFSVGVDVPRLGLMLMNGQPKSTSEYIQATSRVGRGAVPGLVVVLYGATRPRDRSHYEQFVSFHKSLYRKVEPTSVTPFSPPSRARALHAALVTLMRHWGGLVTEDSAGLFDSSDQRVHRVRHEILCRAKITDPAEYEATMRDLDMLIDAWQSWASEFAVGKRKFYFKFQGRQHHNLLTDFGKAQGYWSTARSMRNVDDEVRLAVLGAS